MYKILIFILLLIPIYLVAQDTLVIGGKMLKSNQEVLYKLLPNAEDNNFWEFLYYLAVVESNGDWKAVNGKHLGLWQMGYDAREDAVVRSGGRLKNFDNETFETHSYIVFTPKIQKSFISFYIINTEEIMYEYINKYDGKFVNGIYITKSGIVAACHLVGVGNVKKYFDSDGDIIKLDGNNTSLERYLKLFWDYNW